MRRSVTAMSALGLVAALALWTWLPADEPAPVASGRERKEPGLHPPARAALDDARMPAIATAPATPMATPPVPSSVPPAPPMGPAVPITVAIATQVFVGEVNDLIVTVGTNTGLGEIAFTVQCDPNVMQVRSGTQGGWAVAVGANPRFAAEVSGTEDRVRIRSIASARYAGMAGGSVASVQLQAVATGTTTVLITDVVVKDSSGRSMAATVSASNLQVTVDSVPPLAARK